MIKRTFIQELTWLNIDKGIYDEQTTLTIHFLGILIRKRIINSVHVVTEGSKDTKMGFGK